MYIKNTHPHTQHNNLTNVIGQKRTNVRACEYGRMCCCYSHSTPNSKVVCLAGNLKTNIHTHTVNITKSADFQFLVNKKKYIKTVTNKLYKMMRFLNCHESLEKMLFITLNNLKKNIYIFFNYLELSSEFI